MSEYDNLIANTRYCNDTSVFEINQYGAIYYGAYGRLIDNKTPQFTCPNTEKTYGGEYDLKIGLLTADEAAFAGGKYRTSNEDYYLQKMDEYWLGTGSTGDISSMMRAPDLEDSSWVFTISNTYSLSSFWVENKSYHNVIPVINLKSDILYTSGNGTKSSPYVVQP